MSNNNGLGPPIPLGPPYQSNRDLAMRSPPNLAFDGNGNSQDPEAVRKMFGIEAPDLSSTEVPRNRNRSIQCTPVEFGPALATRGQLCLYQDDSEAEVNRTIYVQCDADPAGLPLVDLAGDPLYPTVQVVYGANGIALENYIDIVPGSITRIPIVGSKVSVNARIFKPFPNNVRPDVFNRPPASQEAQATLLFFMRSFQGTGVAYTSDYYAKPQRKLANVAPGAGFFSAPIAWGAMGVTVIGNAAVLTFDFVTDATVIGPFPANNLAPINLPQNVQRLRVHNSAVGATPFEIQYYVGL
jgi:hypothetical protein